jgi:DnaJ homolog subfamily C member 3
MSAHPDKGGSEAKMAAVNEAYEVLSDPELRARFDNGDDPNDPAQGQGGYPGGGFPGGGFHGGGFPGGHPFAQFFQGGGGGQQFHFRSGF